MGRILNKAIKRITAKEKESVVPTKPAPPNIFTQALASINDECVPVGNFISVSQDKDLQELFELAGIAKNKGMQGQVQHIGRRIIATALEKQGMSLLKMRKEKYSQFDIARVHADGKFEVLKSGGRGGEWDLKPLRDYDLHMPDEILRAMPDEIVGNANVFVPSRDDDIFIKKDPIVGVKLYSIGTIESRVRYWYYAGVYIWD